MPIQIDGDAYTLVTCIVDELNRAGRDASFSFAHPSDTTSKMHLHGDTTLEDVVRATDRVDAILHGFEKAILEACPHLSHTDVVTTTSLPSIPSIVVSEKVE